jgi:autotransporter-associated beta strand protein
MKLKLQVVVVVACACQLSSIALAQTFIPTSGNQFWNVNGNWTGGTFPNSSGAAAVLPTPTGGDLTVNLGQPITVGSLTIGKSQTENLNVTVGEGTQTLTFDGGTASISNGFSSAATGQTIIEAPLAFTATLTVAQNDSQTLQLNGSLTGGANGLTVNRVGTGTNGSGTVVLGAANSYTGTTKLSSPATNQNFLVVRLDDANAIPGGIADTGGTSNLQLDGSVVLVLGAGDFRRGLGTGADKVQFTNQGNSGWAALGQDRVVKVCCNTVGPNPDRLIWGSSGANFGTLVLGHNTADKTVDLQNTLDLNTGTGTVSRTIRIVNGSAPVDAIISGPIEVGQGTGNLTFTGATAGDGTVSLTAANTWNGTTTFNSGVTVRLENAAALPNGNLTLSANGIVGLGLGNDSFSRALGTAAGQVQITTGGGFAAFGGNKTVNLGGAGATVTWGAGNFVASGSSLTLGDTNSDATLDFQNGIDLSTAGNDRTILAPDGGAAVDGKVSGVITGGGNLRKNNPGTLEISNANTYTGTTLINAGTLLLTSATSIPGGIAGGNTNAIVFTGTAENPVATLGLGQGDFTSELNATSGAGRVTLGTNAGFAAYGADRIVNFKQSNVTQQVVWGTGGFVTGVLGLSASGADAMVDLQNPIDLNGAARKVKVANGTANIDGTLSGVIGGATSLEKDGGGTLALTAANTYSGGTIVSQGRLLVNNTSGSGTGSGSVTVNAGTLGGTGSIAGAVTVNGGAHIAPGASIESLDVASLTLESGSILDFELGAPGTSDLLNVTANDGLTINGGSLNLFDAGGLAAGTYTLIDYAGALQGTGISAFLNQTPVGPAGFTYSLTNTGSTVNLNVTAIGVNDADFNGDGMIDAGDYVVWRKFNPATGTGTQGTGDANGDTNVDQLDYDEWRENFGSASPGSGGSGTVPEPSSLVFSGIAVLLLSPRRMRWICA